MDDTAPLFLRSYYQRLCNINPYRDEVMKCFQPDSAVLDAGCGSGQHGWGVVRALRPQIRELVGVDISREQLDQNELVDSKVVAPLDAIPLKDASFDLVLCSNVIEHLENPVGVFQEFSRLLKPGGHVVAMTFNIYNFAYFLSAKLPTGIRTRMKSIVFNKALDEGTFPTYYRCNSHHAFMNVANQAGLREENFSRYTLSQNHWQNRYIKSLFLVAGRMTDIPPLHLTKELVIARLVKP